MSIENKIESLTKSVDTLNATMQRFVAAMTQKPISSEPVLKEKKKRAPINKSSIPPIPESEKLKDLNAPDNLTHTILKDTVLELVKADISKKNAYKSVLNGFRKDDGLPAMKVSDLKEEDLGACWVAVHEL